MLTPRNQFIKPGSIPKKNKFAKINLQSIKNVVLSLKKEESEIKERISVLEQKEKKYIKMATDAEENSTVAIDTMAVNADLLQVGIERQKELEERVKGLKEKIKKAKEDKEKFEKELIKRKSEISIEKGEINGVFEEFKKANNEDVEKLQKEYEKQCLYTKSSTENLKKENEKETLICKKILTEKLKLFSSVESLKKEGKELILSISELMEGVESAQDIKTKIIKEGDIINNKAIEQQESLSLLLIESKKLSEEISRKTSGIEKLIKAKVSLETDKYKVAKILNILGLSETELT